LLVDIADWFELLREHREDRIQVDETFGAYAREPTVRSFESLDRARCYPICFFGECPL
jgi:hypothetical protein